MDINRIDGVHEPSLNQARQEEQRRRSTEDVRPADQVNISPEAQKAADVARYVSLAKKLPDVRPEKLAEAKERLDAQSVQDDENIYRTVARRMLDDLL
ncbi:MAG: hypothetical protein C4520_05255 [Candidatus Abyssobacteria bacterium SURF_5]|uniref:Flagellar biosynthesis anti-sigma factor FlgM n=1 Tax=Abyssobacteria bacterium (strain SURF_5) TaxID=2093360 RepID=A0A3A4P3B8_ABYX5|nr:MAG: hypothetical protein C4520_05255 [Candidatus Abyssubacteria bacterium SURF_5]